MTLLVGPLQIGNAMYKEKLKGLVISDVIIFIFLIPLYALRNLLQNGFSDYYDIQAKKYHTNVETYRPINLLSNMSKHFEKILIAKLNPILTEKIIISNHQFRFSRQRSPTELTHRLVNAEKRHLRSFHRYGSVVRQNSITKKHHDIFKTI